MLRHHWKKLGFLACWVKTTPGPAMLRTPNSGPLSRHITADGPGQLADRAPQKAQPPSTASATPMKTVVRAPRPLRHTVPSCGVLRAGSLQVLADFNPRRSHGKPS
jgi:hypothetical protein